MSAVGLIFCPGLLEVIQSTTPSSLSFFERLPTAPVNVLGIYVLVLMKKGCRPKLYIGSGTAAYRSVRVRLVEYVHRVSVFLPWNGAEALDTGYRIIEGGHHDTNARFKHWIKIAFHGSIFNQSIDSSDAYRRKKI